MNNIKDTATEVAVYLKDLLIIMVQSTKVKDVWMPLLVGLLFGASMGFWGSLVAFGCIWFALSVVHKTTKPFEAPL